MTLYSIFTILSLCPQYNFVGRILGPRGLTAKQLEAETGCKIMVRGKSSMRDKKKVKYSQRRPVILFFSTLGRPPLLPPGILSSRGFTIPAPAIPASPIVSQMAQNNSGPSAVPSISPAAPEHVAGGHRADAWWMRFRHLIGPFAKRRTCAVESTDSCSGADG